MSVNVEVRVDDRGDATHAERAWELKERIRQADDVLKQRRGFFMDAYRRSTTHLLFETDADPDEGEDDRLVAFASIRRDGYILFLAVAPGHRGRGYGERLIARAAENHTTVTCHARTTNDDALGFYQHVGFEIERRIDNYYEDGGDAFYLKFGPDESLADRLSDLVRR